MRRPVGVILSCVILGFVALSLLGTAAIFLFMIFIGMGVFVQPGQPAPDPAFLHGFFIVLSLICVAFAAWAIITLVGLARMRTWARYSVIVIGAGLVLIGLLATAGTLLSLTLAPLPANQNPAAFRFGMIFGVLIDLGIAAIGIWWLIYFTLRSTREAFALAATPQAPPLIGYAPPPSPYAASTYQVAAYIPTPDPAAPPIAAPTPIYVQTAPAPPRRPLAISIIAWLLIATAVCCLPSAVLPFPLFICGVLITGMSAHLTVLCLAIIYALVGIGLLRLEKIALYAAYAIQLFALVNAGLLLVPSYRDRMMDYIDSLIQKMTMGMPMPPMFDNHTMGLMMLPGLLFGALFGLAILGLLIHYRAAFDHPAPSR